MSWQSKAKTVIKYTNPVVNAADRVKDVMDPRTDVLSGIDNPFNNPKPQANPGNQPQNAAAPPQVNGWQDTQAVPNTNQQGANTSGPDLAYYDTQAGMLRDMLSRSGNALNQGMSNINDSYNREVSGANQQRSRAMEDFGVRREDTTRAKQGALDMVGTNARTLSDSVRRILGLASGSGSSAYQLAAPNAIARQASVQRGRVLGDYGQNERDLSLAETRATEDFGSLLEDLARQRKDREGELRGGVLENEQGINQQLAEVAAKRAAASGQGYGASIAAQEPYRQAINERQSQLDSLFERFRSPTLQAKPVNVQTPQLRDYAVDRAALAPNAQSGSPYEPFMTPLRREFDEEEMY